MELHLLSPFDVNLKFQHLLEINYRKHQQLSWALYFFIVYLEGICLIKCIFPISSFIMFHVVLVLLSDFALSLP
jgi:hypothetical protein